jgi:hypothetical protein
MSDAEFFANRIGDGAVFRTEEVCIEYLAALRWRASTGTQAQKSVIQ